MVRRNGAYRQKKPCFYNPTRASCRRPDVG